MEQVRDRDRVPIFHIQGDRACGKIAFYWLGGPPQLGEEITVDRVELLDGNHPKIDSDTICGSCGRPINVKDPTLAGV